MLRAPEPRTFRKPRKMRQPQLGCVGRIKHGPAPEKKFVEELRYMHRNPGKRGLVKRPEDYLWSSFRHYAYGEAGVVEIESQWTARKREQVGIFLTLRLRPPAENPRPSAALTGHPRE